MSLPTGRISEVSLLKLSSEINQGTISKEALFNLLAELKYHISLSEVMLDEECFSPNAIITQLDQLKSILKYIPTHKFIPTHK